MKKINIFVDGSVDNKSKIGFASYLLLNENVTLNDNLKKQIKLKMFEDTSSTKLEIQALLWALEEIEADNYCIYTDCQNILSLLDRREKLESNNYFTKTGKLLKNHKYYKEFYLLIDKKNCEFIKVKGHKKSSLKDDIDNIFSLVDKTARKTLREYINRQ